jgi:hypothetical protein
MKITHLASAVSLALACTIGSAWSGAAAPASDGQLEANAPAWLANIADQKLFAVDGSSITLSPGDDKLALAMVSAGGAEQTKTFALMSDNLGTISDAAHVIGFFRVTDSGLEAQYADGHTESLMLNGAGGISLATHGSNSSCQSWYPSGHVFSEAERRAALADYAGRLGLSQTVSAKAPHAASSCPAQAQKAAAPAPSSRSAHHGTQVAASNSDAAFVPIMVRTSVVHAVDGGVAAPALPTPGPIWAVSATQQTSERPPTQVAAEQPAQTGLGASQCLSVESDGANLGFRNQCTYTVAFAYCLQTATEQAASCDIGTKTGNVAPSAFTPLVLDANIKSGDAEHDFRWVACSGGDVTAHLDRTDPPAGRCVRSKTS